MEVVTLQLELRHIMLAFHPYPAIKCILLLMIYKHVLIVLGWGKKIIWVVFLF